MRKKIEQTNEQIRKCKNVPKIAHGYDKMALRSSSPLRCYSEEIINVEAASRNFKLDAAAIIFTAAASLHGCINIA